MTSVACIFVVTLIVCRSQEEVEVVFVGLHARRGDRIQKWKHRAFGSERVGTFEGKFFNRAMENYRARYNVAGRRTVVFIPTSDNAKWLTRQWPQIFTNLCILEK